MPYQGYWFDDGYHIVATTSEYVSLLGARVTHIGDTDDLSPKIRTMTTMRFPDNVTQWRFQHEEEALQRRTDY